MPPQANDSSPYQGFQHPTRSTTVVVASAHEAADRDLAVNCARRRMEPPLMPSPVHVYLVSHAAFTAPEASSGNDSISARPCGNRFAKSLYVSIKGRPSFFLSHHLR